MFDQISEYHDHSQVDIQNYSSQDFPGGAVVKNLPANAEDRSSIPGLWRSHMPQNN